VPGLPRRRVEVYVAINENGDHYLSQIDAQDALTNLSEKRGGQAFRVVDVTVDIPYASEQESGRRIREQLKVRIID
jgi:hypothetical protein